MHPVHLQSGYTECTQFTCEVGTQKIALLQEEIAAVDAALVSEGCPYWSVSGSNSNCEGTGDGKCIQSHDGFDGSTKYASSMDCTFTALSASQATLTYGGIENCSNPACACNYLQIGGTKYCDLNTSQGDIPFTITIGQMLNWVTDDENKLTG